MRDSFIKSLKKKSGQATSKHDNLRFLMKVVQKDDTVSSMEDSQQLLESEDEKQAQTYVEIQSQNTSKETYNPGKKKSRLQHDIDREILKALSSSNTAHDEEESFFFSVIPAVRRVSEEEKLDFHMSALQLMKDINSRRKEMPVVFETTFSSASTSNIPNCNSTFFFC